MDLKNFRSFVIDASTFIRYFSGAIATSLPHIYLSALPFAPTGSLVSQHYASSFPQLVHLERGRLSHWPSLELVISTARGKVQSIALSSDGLHIASGLEDGTICVWSIKTGEIAAGPFTGHTDLVWSVAFSPDGQCIASGSEDGTVFVWDAATGETVAGPFTEHMGPVLSIEFSPDGKHIVSGSSDQTICVWNTTTGKMAAVLRVDGTFGST
jgi:WD40 repeat protein